MCVCKWVNLCKTRISCLNHLHFFLQKVYVCDVCTMHVVIVRCMFYKGYLCVIHILQRVSVCDTCFAKGISVWYMFCKGYQCMIHVLRMVSVCDTCFVKGIIVWYMLCFAKGISVWSCFSKGISVWYMFFKGCQCVIYGLQRMLHRQLCLTLNCC